ncbi:MAG TPA: phage tail sheath C-terminal domain-containing protein [Gemmatimonadales bacterium]
MPVAPTYPGVYIEEVPSGVRTITGVATSIAAFIDRFQRGPVDEAVRVLSMADFEREFGGLDAASEASYAIQQFFVNGGSEAVVVRVGARPPGTAPVAASLVLLGGAAQVFRVRAGQRIRGLPVDNPGRWGNGLRVEVDYDTVTLPNAGIDPDNLLTPGELFNLTVSEVELRNGRMTVLRSETYRNLTMRAGARTNALDVVNAGSRLIQLDRTGLLPAAVPTPPFRPDPTGTVGIAPPGGVPASGSNFSITVDPDGIGAAAAVAIPAATLVHTGVTSFSDLRPSLEAAIREAANAPAATDAIRPLLAGATVKLVGGAYRVLLGLAGANFDPRATVTFGGATATSLGLSGAGVFVGPQMLGPTIAGTDGGAMTSATDFLGTQLAKTGMYALEDVDLFNILCIPAAADQGAVVMRAIYSEAETYCESKRAFLIVDIRDTVDDPDAMQTWLTDNATLRHRNAAVYFPRVQVPDPLNQGRLRSRAASGTLAGLYAQTDVARGVWKAPAGTDVRLRNVQDLDYILTDRENGVLNPLGANCLRSFPIFGPIAWGARTLDGADQIASEWKYVPVRRFALFLEESLYRGTKWVVFEPNDEPLWAQIRLNIGAFMQSLFRQGAFQGMTPREAYFVRCDRETTTQTDINLGIVNILVGFAPLKPAEFVIIRIQQMAGQIPT